MTTHQKILIKMIIAFFAAAILSIYFTRFITSMKFDDNGLYAIITGISCSLFFLMINDAFISRKITDRTIKASDKIIALYKEENDELRSRILSLESVKKKLKNEK